jgi:hypothetical protein
MYRASLAAAVLGLGALVMSGPAYAAPPQKSGVVLAQWGGPPPPPWAGGGGHCQRLWHRLQRFRAIRNTAPPWERRGIQPGIRETRAQMRYYCPGY